MVCCCSMREIPLSSALSSGDRAGWSILYGRHIIFVYSLNAVLFRVLLHCPSAGRSVVQEGIITCRIEAPSAAALASFDEVVITMRLPTTKWKGAKSENGRWSNLHRVKWQRMDRQEWCRTLGVLTPKQVSFLLCHCFHHLHLRCWPHFRRSDRVVLRPATDWLLNSKVVNNRFVRKVVNDGSLNAAPSQLWFLIVVNNFQWCMLSPLTDCWLWMPR